MAGSDDPSDSADSAADHDIATETDHPTTDRAQDAPEESRTGLTESDSIKDDRYAVTHQEAIESDEYLYGKVFSTDGEPGDADEGQVRLDYDHPESEYIVVIMPEARVDVRKKVNTRVVFPRGGSEAEASRLGF